MKRKVNVWLFILYFAIALIAPVSTIAQSDNYRQVDLVSNVPGLALNIDHALVNPWGIAGAPGQAFRIVNNTNGSFTKYDPTGAQELFGARIATPAGATSIPHPTGVAANPTSLFVAPGSLTSPFLFSTEEGTISGEYADANGNILLTSILVVDNSSRGAVYTGLAVLTPDCCAPFLAVADFHGGFIDTFTGSFDPLGIPGAFTDPDLPAGYAPYNLSVIENQVFVLYAPQDAAGHSPVTGAGNGIVDIYDLDGTFVRRFAAGGPLNVKWGIVKSSSNFAAFSNDILIGNSGDGIIHAFDPATGQFLGSLKDGNGNVIVNLNLHGLVFGAESPGDADTLYLTAELAAGVDGVFGAISVNTGSAGPDFSLNASSNSATVMAGQSATFMLTATPIADFRGIFSFSCAAPAGVTCTIGQTTVDQEPQHQA
ncbi:MAG TPA: TIGR03118 family protein [Terracidiphilus sp.]